MAFVFCLVQCSNPLEYIVLYYIFSSTSAIDSSFAVQKGHCDVHNSFCDDYCVSHLNYKNPSVDIDVNPKPAV